MANPAVRQRLLELLDAFVGDVRIMQVQLFELGQSLDVLQPGVGYLGAGEVVSFR